MNNVMRSIRKEVAEIIRPSIGPIFTTHVTYAALGILLFSPLAGMVGQLLLRLSGQPALADQDIAWFLVNTIRDGSVDTVCRLADCHPCLRTGVPDRNQCRCFARTARWHNAGTLFHS